MNGALAAYRALTGLGGPAIRLVLQRRRARGKEDPERFGERLGLPSRPRPDGPLVWVHAASVGEAQSVLLLLDRLLAGRQHLSALVTTGTVSSARLLDRRLPARAFHQYVPVDRRPWVRRFLDHWRPDLALWVESELWPNLVTETQARFVPMVLVNGRMSARSFAGWRRWPGLARALLGGFALAFAQSQAEARRFAELGAPDVRSIGNLKYAAEPLPADEAALAALHAAIAGRPAWLAASTHRGEEEIVARVHRSLVPLHPGLVTVLAPRHATRGDEVAALLAGRGLAVARRAAGELPGPSTDIHLADTMGELGLLYRATDLAFVGGSLVPRGGQNLLEPARLGAAVLHGPHVANFAEIAADLAAAGAAEQVADEAALTAAADRLLSDPGERRRRGEAGRLAAEARRAVLDDLLAALAPLLDRIGGTR